MAWVHRAWRAAVPATAVRYTRHTGHNAVHAIAARAAANAAATALLGPMYTRVRADLYEIGIAYSDLSCCDEHMLN